MTNEKLQPGNKAIGFELPDSQGNPVKLSDYEGKYIVLYFYPKDNTPGCTKEACAFRDNYEDFTDLNAVIIGISLDNQDSHVKFKEKYGLPFILLSDEDKHISEKYGVFGEKNLFGRKVYGIIRSTFLINPEGKIKKIWKKVKVAGHIEEVLEYLREETS